MLVVAGVAEACGTPDARKLGGESQAGQGDDGSGGKGGTTGGAHSSGSGGTHANSDGGMGAEGGGTGICGDGVRQGDEQCDDGNDASGDGCNSRCQIEAGSAACGNGTQQEGEDCDDGNLQPGDGCDAQCHQEKCGNKVLDAGEQCDPPKAGSCTANCHVSSADCGDGKVQTDEGEQCDDGNDEAGDGCFECQNECGDGKIDAAAGEQCEPTHNEKGCTTDCHCGADCKWLPICGDGILQSGEQCDPGNGTTCVDCRLVTPHDCDGEGGCGGSGNECVPDATGGPVTNGNFDTTSAGWTTNTSGLSANVVSDGQPAPMALELSFASGPVRAEAGAYECIPINAGVKYEVSAQYLIPSDTPDGVGVAATALLYAGTQCSGSFLLAYNGPQGLVRNAWTPYSFQIDTSRVSNVPPLRLLLRMDVVRPANVDGTRVRWDSVALTAPGARCGDCHVDIGEECDDGNHTVGDGCGADCRLETCGDGVIAGNEQCDDGNTTFGGNTCTPGCRQANACDTCSAGQCQTTLAACFGLTGNVQTGPRAGTPRSTLCDDLLACVRSTGCDLASRPVPGSTTPAPFIDNCYCGTSGDGCFDGHANGSCKAAIEAALGSTNPDTLQGRLSGNDPDYPSLGAVRDLIACQNTSCSTDCARAPKCGDGVIEDRNFSISLNENGKDVPCDDALTASGHGCSVEECDGGDRCDSNCMLIVCGNGLTQPGEDCDDGNDVSNDGCSATCTAEYHCGDGNIEPPFEQCDRASTATDPGCTEAEAHSNPDACACDGKCKLVECGNGIVQAPWEQCDPPDGQTCSDQCQRVGQSACEVCIDESPSDGMVQITYCDSDPKCLAVERCMVQEKCFDPVPFNCYCGTNDTSACSVATFVPTGPCLDQIKAGTAATTNANIITQMQAFDDATGVATSILNDVFSTAPQCHDLCF